MVVCYEAFLKDAFIPFCKWVGSDLKMGGGIKKLK
jgi:hypothetical protein